MLRGITRGAPRAVLEILRSSLRIVLLVLVLVLVLLVLLLSLRVVLVILPVGSEVMVVIASAPTLVASPLKAAARSASEVERPPYAAMVAPEIAIVLIASLIFLLPVVRGRMRPRS